MGKVVSIVLSLVLVVSGCSAGDTRITLSFWNGFTGPDRPVLEELVKRFNDSNPRVRVQLNIMPWDVLWQKMPAAFNAGRGPDLAAFDTARLAMYASKGFLSPVDDWYSANPVPFHAPAANATRYQDKRFGVPFTFTPVLLFYNKKLFAEAGLHRPPATWQEWQEYAVKLTRSGNGDTPSQYGIAIPDHECMQVWPVLLWGNGGDFARFDEPASVEAVRTWTDLIKDKKISPVGLTGPDADKLFETGKAAMEVVGPWMTNGFTKAGIDYGLAMVPAGPTKQVTIASSQTLALGAQVDDAKRKAAHEFMSFWTSPQSQQHWSTGTNFPTIRQDVEPANSTAATFHKYAGQAEVLLPGVPEFQKIYIDTVEPAIQRISYGREPAAEAMARAAAEIRPLLPR